MRIYTDGGCWGNPGPGAWAYCIVTDAGEICKSGYEQATTNNKMELMAVIQALKAVRKLPGTENRRIQLFTDSQYVKNGITSWIKRWIKNGWKTANKQPVKNQELWKTLHNLAGNQALEWHWVQGHSGNSYNEKCDSLVQNTIKENS